MKLSQYLKAYQNDTEKASTQARTLSVSGIAIIWIFNKSDILGKGIPGELILPLFLFALSLMFDYLHYLYGSFAYHYLYKKNLNKALKNATNEESDPSFPKPKHINKPKWFLFAIKHLLVFIGYIMLGIFLVSKIKLF